MLGICISPTLRWIKQFSKIENKMKQAIWKLRKTSVTLGNAYLFYNMYLTIQVYFGCGIVKLIPQQKKF